MSRVWITFHATNRNNGAVAAMLDVVSNFSSAERQRLVGVIPHHDGNLSEALDALNVRFVKRRIYSNRINLNFDFTTLIRQIFYSIPKLISNLLVALKLSKEIGRNDIVYANTSDNMLALFISIFSGARLIYHIREFGLEDQNSIQLMPRRIYFLLLYRMCSDIIVISKALLQVVPDRYHDRCRLIYDDVHSK